MIPFSVVSYAVLILSLSRKIERSAGLSIGRPGSRPSSTRFPISATCLLIVAATSGSSDSVTVRMPSGRFVTVRLIRSWLKKSP